MLKIVFLNTKTTFKWEVGMHDPESIFLQALFHGSAAAQLLNAFLIVIFTQSEIMKN